MRKLLQLYIGLWIAFFPLSLEAGNMQEVAQAVLDKLHGTHGQFSAKKPKLEITKSVQNVAVYLKGKNAIQLEEKAYLLCRSFGKDSLAALAFILGHELIHASQMNNVLPKTSFISYDKALKSSLEIEQNADVQGIFLSYLAGFKTIHLIPQIIDKMYTYYELRSKDLRGYPTEDERKNSYHTVIEQANELIELFHLANEMSVIEEYAAALHCLEYISRFYQGKEIYNNLGVNYALLALNYTGVNSEPYVYPLELDWNIRIKKPKTGRGEPTDMIERMQQRDLFKKSKEYFSLASQMDANYTITEMNIFSVMIMMNDLQSAKQFYRNHLRNYSGKKGLQEMYLKIRSAYAILQAKSNQAAEAMNIWMDLSSKENKLIAIQAQQNLAALSKNKSPILSSNAPCHGIELSKVQGAELKLRQVETAEWIALDKSNSIEKKKQSGSTVYSFIKEGHRFLSIQKLTLQSAQRLDVKLVSLSSFGKDSWIYRCNRENVAYLVDETGQINYVIRFQRFREILE